MCSCLRTVAEDLEAEVLADAATLSSDAKAASREHPQEPDDIRTAFHRDYTRILHSRAFRRLRHKTQVIISPANDHICTRLEHSLCVCSVATTIARALGLNQDLVAAIALGHDLGHAPFGHQGEHMLDILAQRKGLRFQHELHSLRVVDELDSPYEEHRGLNLTFAVRDGIACHYGEGFERELSPNRDREPSHLTDTSRGSRPATPEGCVVRMADKLAYLGRDLEDALQAGLVTVSDVPKGARDVLGTDNRTIINRLVHDVVKNSDTTGKVAISADVHEALTSFYEFSKERIYKHEKVTQRFGQIDEAMEFMFVRLDTAIEKAMTSGAEDVNLFPKEDINCFLVLAEFLKDDVRSWRDEVPARLTIDFIAGMTDSFFNASFKDLFLPTSSL